MERTLKYIATSIFVAFALTLFTGRHAAAQQVQIPTLQVCNQTKVTGKAAVTIVGRQDATHTGGFTVAVDLACAPSGYPAGSLMIGGISMNDSPVQGTIAATTFEQVTSMGRVTPTAYLSGRCKSEKVSGCRFWMMVADNKRSDQKGTADVVSFVVFDGSGKRVAYGAGPVTQGDLNIAPTAY